jgi:hypothetical protein
MNTTITSAMGSTAPTSNAKILNAASLLMMHLIALRHSLASERQTLKMRTARFCFRAHCRTLPFAPQEDMRVARNPTA